MSAGKHTGPVVTPLYVGTERWCAAKARRGTLSTKLVNRGKHATDSSENQGSRLLDANLFNESDRVVTS